MNVKKKVMECVAKADGELNSSLYNRFGDKWPSIKIGMLYAGGVIGLVLTSTVIADASQAISNYHNASEAVRTALPVIVDINGHPLNASQIDLANSVVLPEVKDNKYGLPFTTGGIVNVAKSFVNNTTLKEYLPGIINRTENHIYANTCDNSLEVVSYL